MSHVIQNTGILAFRADSIQIIQSAGGNLTFEPETGNTFMRLDIVEPNIMIFKDYAPPENWPETLNGLENIIRGRL